MTQVVNNLFRTAIIIAFTALMAPSIAWAHGGPKKYTRAEYIATWKEVAIREMHEHGIPASITLAQAILESGDGNSELARKANNHFGIKCHDWNGKKSYHDDDDKGECFRSYKSAAQSFDDHSIFLKRSRYLFLYDYDVTDYKAWAKGLKKAGYATNPKYPELLIRLIEENDLQQYDKMKPGKRPATPRKGQSEKDDDAIVIALDRGLEVFESDNRIRYIITDQTYTPDELADRMHLGGWQIRKYNDLDRGADIDKGERIYLQPKRNKSKAAKTHVVVDGETLWDVSQQYGVKMNKILRRSKLPKDYQIKPGDTLNLR